MIGGKTHYFRSAIHVVTVPSGLFHPIGPGGFPKNRPTLRFRQATSPRNIASTSENYMGVSKIRGKTPKWMVYDGKTLLKWMIWGTIIFWKHPHAKVQILGADADIYTP